MMIRKIIDVECRENQYLSAFSAMFMSEKSPEIQNWTNENWTNPASEIRNPKS